MTRSLIDRWTTGGKQQTFVVESPVAKADESSMGGAMVALLVPQEVSNSIYVRDGLDPGEHHITLFFLTNDAATIPYHEREKINRIVERVAERHATLIGVLDDHYRSFPPGPNSNGLVPWWRKPVVLGVQDLRDDIAKEFDRQGVEYSKNFEWSPHVTITYLPPNQKPQMDMSLKKEPLTFTNVVVRFAGKDTVHGLTGRPAS